TEARGYLAGLPDSVATLTQGDLLEAVEATDKTWDVIFTGFAVHHLMSDDKARFFPGCWALPCRNRLVDSGGCCA
ncbi:MAG: hypothetical protein AABZ18_09005, partial [Pseudomonadota bacterium]